MSHDWSSCLRALGVPVRQIQTDSRQVSTGDVFVAVQVAGQDGRVYIADALQRGAAAVLWDSDGYRWPSEHAVPQLGVPGLSAQLGALSSHVYGRPSHEMWLVGITGTNGKTSCSQWIAQALQGLGRRVGVVGTLGSGVYGALQATGFTTPDAVTLQRDLAAMQRQGVTHVALEVSSHGLAQGRVDGTDFDVAVFTNLTRDHLDYHGDMAAYRAAKARLFDWPTLRGAVIHVEDPMGRELVDHCRGRGIPVLSYGVREGDLHFAEGRVTVDAVAGQVVTPLGTLPLATQLVGEFNAANLLAVLGVLLMADVSLEDALKQLARVQPAPGRMQRVGPVLAQAAGRAGQHGATPVAAPLVVVDYAHTPDALEKTLLALRPAVGEAGQLVCVFGCGGDRDPGKRPVMGALAAHLADQIWVTSDNPRSEDPTTIIEQIVQGVGGPHPSLHQELDRAGAIVQALDLAGPQDVVLIAGKGHEAYQEIQGVRLPYSDVAVVEAWWSSRAEEASC